VYYGNYSLAVIRRRKKEKKNKKRKKEEERRVERWQFCCRSEGCFPHN
jgi:hypothetical protein